MNKALWKYNRKKKLKEEDPFCIYCGGYVYDCDLSHKIRLSETVKYECCELNTGLAHRDCHFIFDNEIHKAIHLPRFYEVMSDIKFIDEKIYNKIKLNYEKNGIDTSNFP